MESYVQIDQDGLPVTDIWHQARLPDLERLVVELLRKNQQLRERLQSTESLESLAPTAVEGLS